MSDIRPELIEHAKNHTPSEKTAKGDAIRARVRNNESELLEVIAAETPESMLENRSRVLNTAAYCRVSTDNLEQITSYELQKAHYEEMILSHPEWHLSGIYADEGTTGTNTLHRDGFRQLMQDCDDGKIDLIITKSVSRFARNLIDCLDNVRRLKNHNPPIGIFFEQENLKTLDSSSEMILIVLSMVAQEESHIKSEAMNSSIEMRFRRGMFLTPGLLGYDHTGPGELRLNPNEALTVKLMFYLLLNGAGTTEIANTLMDLKRPTKLGRYKWTNSTVSGILHNERYCGDVLARKTFTPDYLTHKTKRNVKNRNQYIKRDHHEAIVTREQWEAAQQILGSFRYQHRGGYVPMTVIENGALKGFISINRAWAGYELEEYFRVCRKIMGVAEENEKPETEATAPEPKAVFSVVSSKFFSHVNEPVMNVSRNFISFNKACIRRFDSCMWIELLFNPVERLIAIRPCGEDHPNAIRWRTVKAMPANIGATKFCTMLFDMTGFDGDYIYKFPAMVRTRDDDTVIFFDLDNYSARLIGGEKALIRARNRAEEARKKAIAENRHSATEEYTDKPVEVFSDAFATDDYFGSPFSESHVRSRLHELDTGSVWDVTAAGTQLSEDHKIGPEEMEKLNDDILEAMISEEEESKQTEPETEKEAHDILTIEREEDNDGV